MATAKRKKAKVAPKAAVGTNLEDIMKLPKAGLPALPNQKMAKAYANFRDYFKKQKGFDINQDFYLLKDGDDVDEAWEQVPDDPCNKEVATLLKWKEPAQGISQPRRVVCWRRA